MLAERGQEAQGTDSKGHSEVFGAGAVKHRGHQSAGGSVSQH